MLSGSLRPNDPLTSRLHPLIHDLCRLARFGANISDAHSCFIFLPSQALVLTGLKASHEKVADGLHLCGLHSLSDAIVPNCVIPHGAGFVGWVAKNQQPIHVSPFDRDSRILGTYTDDQFLKSFVAVPARFRLGRDAQLVGVIGCDSRKSFAFSKLQIKLLEELASECARFIETASSNQNERPSELPYREFIQRGIRLADEMGIDAVEVLRLRYSNSRELEKTLGPAKAGDLIDQVKRLICDALPPHYPVCTLASGDTVVLVDAMMSAFYENKFQAICRHVNIEQQQVQLEFLRAGMRDIKQKSFTIDDLVRLSAEQRTFASVEAQRRWGIAVGDKTRR